MQTKFYRAFRRRFYALIHVKMQRRLSLSIKLRVNQLKMRLKTINRFFIEYCYCCLMNTMRTLVVGLNKRIFIQNTSSKTLVNTNEFSGFAHIIFYLNLLQYRLTVTKNIMGNLHYREMLMYFLYVFDKNCELWIY